MSAGAESVAVIGAGLMGHGIAEVFAAAGSEVAVFDPDEAALGSLHARIGIVLESLGEPATALERVHAAGSLAEAVARAELVVEAAPEDLELKRRIFGELDAAAAAGAILATNTSVISIGEIAGGAARAERIVGTHWWNPPTWCRWSK